MMSAQDHFARLWSVTVFPVPKPPGIAADPPCAIGKNVSITLCPVISGFVGASFCLYGLGIFTGHSCSIVISTFFPCGVSMVAIGSFTVYFPSCISRIFPLIPNGTSILCSTAIVSFTVPSMSTCSTFSPSLTVGMNSHFLFGSIGSAFTPLGTNGPDVFHIFVRGFCSPS